MATEAQLRAIKKWQDKTDEIRFRTPKGKKEVYTKHAEERGESLTTFLNRAAEETMQRDQSEGQL